VRSNCPSSHLKRHFYHIVAMKAIVSLLLAALWVSSIAIRVVRKRGEDGIDKVNVETATLPNADRAAQGVHWEAFINGIYTIQCVSARGELNGKFLMLRSAAAAHLRSIELVGGDPTAASSQWRFSEVSAGTYTIENVNAYGEFLNLHSRGGSPLQLAHDPTAASSQWRFARAAGNYAIMNVYDGGRGLYGAVSTRGVPFMTAGPFRSNLTRVVVFGGRFYDARFLKWRVKRVSQYTFWER